MPPTQLLQIVSPEQRTHGLWQGEQSVPLKYSNVPQVMQVFDGVRYFPGTQEVHSVSLFSQFWQSGEQAVQTGTAGAGGRYWVSGQSWQTAPTRYFGKTQLRQLLVSVVQSAQGAVHGLQLGYGSENCPTGQLVHREPTSRCPPVHEVQLTALVQFTQGAMQATQALVPLK